MLTTGPELSSAALLLGVVLLLGLLLLAHREWLLVSFQDLEFEVVGKAFAIFFPIMGTHEVLIESRFLPNLRSLAVEL